ncbi:MAG: threonine--tRNA ligase [Patescibacteria group bacterium]|nr:threonine--tRNA ligase [Patescibacteria group bacterium]
MANNKNNPKIEKIRHSLSHLLAMAVLEKYPNTKLGIGPVIENGFYYDFDFKNNQPNANDFLKLEAKIKDLIKQNLKFKKENINYAEAKKTFIKQPYKLELIEELKKSKKPISNYKTLLSAKPINQLTNNQFTDLCAGPHIISTNEINPEAFKLIRTAGAYWKGSEKNPMLTRIYGVAFETKKELEDYLKWREEIEKRDHRVLGEKMNLFMTDEKIGKGLPLWLPKGCLIRHLLEEYIYELEQENGYQHVLTPVLAKEDLYKTSGHLAHYCDDMYSPIEIEGEKFYLRPMNCPHHHSVFKHKIRSHKELPLRIAEFGMVFRFERSGVLSGMIRARGFTQNDAHIYITPEKLEEEIVKVLKIHKKVFEDFNIKDYWFRLSLPDFKNKQKFGDVKNKKMWSDGSAVLKKVLNKMKFDYVEGIGEATFYGPKIDIQIKNIHGKEDTIATVQVDYYSAGKFNLNYIDKDGKEKPVVIIHRAILGSFERFFAFLLEKTAGELPLWLAPVQAVILNVGLNHKKYAEKILKELRENKIRTEIKSEDSLGKRIRESKIQKIPYILVAGDKEIQNKTVNIDNYKRGQEGEMKINGLIRQIKTEIKNKK